MAAPGAAGCSTTAAGRSGGLGYGLSAASFTDKSTGRHHFPNLFAMTCTALRFLISKNQAFKTFTAFFTLILIDWHESFSVKVVSNLHQRPVGGIVPQSGTTHPIT